MGDAAATTDDYNAARNEVLRARLADKVKPGQIGAVIGGIAGAHPLVGQAYDAVTEKFLPWVSGVYKTGIATAAQVQARISGSAEDKKRAADLTHEAAREVAGTLAGQSAPKEFKEQAKKAVETGTDFVRYGITKDPKDLQEALGRMAKTYAPEKDTVEKVARAFAGDKEAASELFNKYAPDSIRGPVNTVSRIADDVKQAPDRVENIRAALANGQTPDVEDVQGLQRLANYLPVKGAPELQDTIKRIQDPRYDITPEDVQRLQQLSDHAENIHDAVVNLPKTIKDYVERGQGGRGTTPTADAALNVADQLSKTSLGKTLGVTPDNVKTARDIYAQAKSAGSSIDSLHQLAANPNLTDAEAEAHLRTIATGPLGKAANVTDDDISNLRDGVRTAKTAYDTFQQYKSLADNGQLTDDDALHLASRLQESPLGRQLADRIGATQEAIHNHYAGTQNFREAINDHISANAGAVSAINDLASTDYTKLSPAERTEFIRSRLQAIKDAPIGSGIDFRQEDIRTLAHAAGLDPKNALDIATDIANQHSPIEALKTKAYTAAESQLYQTGSDLLGRAGIQASPDDLRAYGNGQKSITDLIPSGDPAKYLSEKTSAYLAEQHGINAPPDVIHRIVTGQGTAEDFASVLPVNLNSDQLIDTASQHASAFIQRSTGQVIPPELLAKVAKGEATLDDVRQYAPNIPDSEKTLQYLQDQMIDQVRGTIPGASHIVNGIAKTMRGDFEGGADQIVNGVKLSVKPSQRQAIETGYNAMKGVKGFGDEVEARAQLLADRRNYRLGKIGEDTPIPESDYPPNLQDPLVKSKSMDVDDFMQGLTKGFTGGLESQRPGSLDDLQTRLNALRSVPKRPNDDDPEDTPADGRPVPAPPQATTATIDPTTGNAKEDDSVQKLGFYNDLEKVLPSSTSNSIREGLQPLTDSISAAVSPHITTLIHPFLEPGEQLDRNKVETFLPGAGSIYTPPESLPPREFTQGEKLSAGVALARVRDRIPPIDPTALGNSAISDNTRNILNAEASLHRSSIADLVSPRSEVPATAAPLYTRVDAQAGQQEIGSTFRNPVFGTDVNTQSVDSTPTVDNPKAPSDTQQIIQTAAGEAGQVGLAAPVIAHGVKARSERLAANEAKAKKVEDQAKAKAKAQQEAKDKAQQEADAKTQKEAAAKAQQEADAKAQQEAAAKAQQEAAAKAQQEAAIKAQQEADAKAQQDAAAKAQQEADAKAQQEAANKAQQDADAKAQQEADAKAQQDAAKDQEDNVEKEPDTDTDPRVEVDENGLPKAPEPPPAAAPPPQSAPADTVVNNEAGNAEDDSDTFTGTNSAPTGPQVSANVGVDTTAVEAAKTADQAAADTASASLGGVARFGESTDSAANTAITAAKDTSTAFRDVDEGINGAAVAGEAASGDEIGALVNGALLGGQTVLSAIGLEDKTHEPAIPPPITDPVPVQQSNLNQTYNPVDPSTV